MNILRRDENRAQGVAIHRFEVLNPQAPQALPASR
jgi:hypothetical protein